MAKSLTLPKTTTAVAAPRILRLRVARIGKTTFAAPADCFVFVEAEDGFRRIKAPQRPKKMHSAKSRELPRNQRRLSSRAFSGESHRAHEPPNNE